MNILFLEMIAQDFTNKRISLGRIEFRDLDLWSIFPPSWCMFLCQGRCKFIKIILIYCWLKLRNLFCAILKSVISFLVWSYRVPSAILTLGFCMMTVFKMNPFILHLIVKDIHVNSIGDLIAFFFYFQSVCCVCLFMACCTYAMSTSLFVLRSSISVVLHNLWISFWIIWKIYSLSSALVFLFFDIYSAWGWYTFLKHIEREIPIKPWYLSSTYPSFFLIEHVPTTRHYTA